MFLTTFLFDLCSGSTADYCYEIEMLSFENAVFNVLLILIAAFAIYWVIKLIVQLSPL